MTFTVEISELADADLEAIYRFIAADSPNAAIRFIRDLRTYCQKLTTMPFRGPALDGFRPDLRTLSYKGRATVAYQVDSKSVLVLRIIYAGQDFPDEWGG